MEEGIVDVHIRTNELDNTKVGIDQLNSLRAELEAVITRKQLIKGCFFIINQSKQSLKKCILFLRL